MYQVNFGIYRNILATYILFRKLQNSWLCSTYCIVCTANSFAIRAAAAVAARESRMDTQGSTRTVCGWKVMENPTRGCGVCSLSVCHPNVLLAWMIQSGWHSVGVWLRFMWSVAYVNNVRHSNYIQFVQQTVSVSVSQVVWTKPSRLLISYTTWISALN